MKTYAVTGATGNTGKIIVEQLLEKGNKVRAIGRSAEKLASLVEKGAEACVGSIDDETTLTKAFTGADGVYAMIPPDFQAKNFRAYQNHIGQAIANAITKARVRNVVFLSSIGAHLSEKTGPIVGLYDQEQRLNKLEGVDILHLRPTLFMENFFNNIGTIKNMGANGSPIRGDISIPMIATQDIGRYAAERLSKLDFSGHIAQELHGQRDLTMTEATSILGKAIGRDDLGYVQFPYEDAEKAMTQMGISPDGARTYVEMAKGFNEGIIIGVEPRSPENTTPTSLEDFAGTFAAAYNAS